jgi:DNA polymerase-3 subunit epsilon
VNDAPRPPRRDRLHLPWQAAELAALDFETTGLDPARDRIVSFGVIPILAGRIRFGERSYREVAPAAPLTGRSIVVHGIRPIDVADAPPIEDVRLELREALDRRVVLAWAAHVEAGFLAGVFGGSPRRWRRRTIDVLRLAVLLDRLEGRSAAPGGYLLEAVADRYGVPTERPHHALDDALTTAELFLVLATHLARHGRRTPRQLLRASRTPGRSARHRSARASR